LNADAGLTLSFKCWQEKVKTYTKPVSLFASMAMTILPLFTTKYADTDWSKIAFISYPRIEIIPDL